MDRIIEFFKSENMYSKEFFEYIKSRTHIFPSNIDLSIFGCFPQVEKEKLVDIKVSIPEIKTLKNLLVNIYELTYAYDLYNELGKNYIDDKKTILIREKKAKEMEKKYIQKSFNKTLTNNVKQR